LPIHFLAADGYELFLDLDRQFPEPYHDPLFAVQRDQALEISSYSRVALTGYDGDALLAADLKQYGRRLLQQGQLRRLLANLAWYGVTYRRLPALGLRKGLAGFGQASARGDDFPTWLEPDFVRRLELRSRWQTLTTPRYPDDHAHPDLHVRRLAYHYLRSPIWDSLFEEADPGLTRLPLEQRHPLLDLRMVAFLLALPALPWCLNKELFRRAMQGILPEEVCRRPKSPLALDPLAIRNAGAVSWRSNFKPSAALASYVQKAMLAKLADVSQTLDWKEMRIFSLNAWLKHYLHV
jgi:asparagine synthase (glutamine-hydrolysing)